MVPGIPGPLTSNFTFRGSITNIKKTDYTQIEVGSTFDIEECDLLRRHNLQSQGNLNIFQSCSTPYFKIESCEIMMRLYKYNDLMYSLCHYYKDIFRFLIGFSIPQLLLLKNVNIKQQLYKTLDQAERAILHSGVIH